MRRNLNQKRIEIIQLVCDSLTNGEIEMGRMALVEGYPFLPKERSSRYFSDQKKLTIFLRDGFIDRYSGERLVYPGALKVISDTFPDEFPYHKNGKMTHGHMAYWHLFPTVDHVRPHAIGGGNDVENMVTTSMMNNGLKSGYTLEDLGWELHPGGDKTIWDGLTRWFFEYVSEHRTMLDDPYVNKYYKILLRSGLYRTRSFLSHTLP